MNYETKKSILKLCQYFELAVFLANCILEIALVFGGDQLIVYYAMYYGIDITFILKILVPIRFLIVTIYFVFIMIYINEKRKQTKESFYAKTKFFKVMSIVSLIFCPEIAVFLIFVAFTKDYDKPQQNVPKIQPKEIKEKVKLDNEKKKQIQKLKHDKHTGKISKELYDKRYNELMKK